MDNLAARISEAEREIFEITTKYVEAVRSCNDYQGIDVNIRNGLLLTRRYYHQLLVNVKKNLAELNTLLRTRNMPNNNNNSGVKTNLEGDLLGTLILIR